PGPGSAVRAGPGRPELHGGEAEPALVRGLNWKPLFFLTSASISVGEVMQPAGPQNGIGIVSTGYLRDPGGPG
ncbi:MAG: hypothetical protein ACREFY_02030, partial [Acetobacteraceae bacterium]